MFPDQKTVIAMYLHHCDILGSINSHDRGPTLQQHVPTNLDHGPMESLFVGNLPYNLSSDEFRAAFERFGDITDVTIATRSDQGRRQSQGYGFIDFRDEGGLQSVSTAARSLNSRGAC